MQHTVQVFKMEQSINLVPMAFHIPCESNLNISAPKFNTGILCDLYSFGTCSDFHIFIGSVGNIDFQMLPAVPSSIQVDCS